MQRYLLRLAYDGSEFHGWQVQPSVRTVQQTLEGALSELAKQPISVNGSGRTDAGVHALRQAAHIDWPLNMTPAQILAAIRSRTPEDIDILGVTPVDSDFHARFDARERCYVFLLEQRHSPFTRRYRSAMPRTALRPDRIPPLLPAFLGEHDFASFCRPTPDLPHTRCTVTEFSLEDMEDHLRFTIRANRFLHNMVRRLTGCVVTLAALGENVEVAKELLAACAPHPRLIPTAPPQGLYLADVIYPGLTEPPIV